MPNVVQRILAGDPVGKRWASASACLSDHGVILLSHFGLLGAYLGIGGATIRQDVGEKIMVAVNSVNQCPYCDRLHTKGLARLAGVSPDVGSTAPETYAVAFADSAMRGKAEAKALLALGAAEGEGRAASMRALATFLMWGSLTGNTVNAVKKRLVGLEPLSGMSIYELTFFVYYGPLFFLVYVVSLVLMQLPVMSRQDWFFQLIGFTLFTLSLVWILPVGLLGLLLRV